MTINFQEVREQVLQMGENMLARERELQELQEQALFLLRENANQLDVLRQKVQTIVQHYDSTLRCALPNHEPLDAHFPLPTRPEKVTILAADGSQIEYDRHAEVPYCLVNVGAIQLCYHKDEAPQTVVHTHLIYDDHLYTPSGVMSDAALALIRDVNERTLMADLAEKCEPPVISLADGPMELWGSKADELLEPLEFQQRLDDYLGVLRRLCSRGISTAGYVDRPFASLVVRLLEIATLPEAQYAEVKHTHRLRGVTDLALYARLLEPGERSALFAIQSQSAANYTNELALHFFYLNVGKPHRPYIARVEVPAWVAQDRESLSLLQAVLVDQCQIMGARPYPYVLHRAHEIARVSRQEKEQVTQMILSERIRRLGVPAEKSNKQFAKDLPGRTRL